MRTYKEIVKNYILIYNKNTIDSELKGSDFNGVFKCIFDFRGCNHGFRGCITLPVGTAINRRR